MPFGLAEGRQYPHRGLRPTPVPRELAPAITPAAPSGRGWSGSSKLPPNGEKSQTRVRGVWGD